MCDKGAKKGGKDTLNRLVLRNKIQTTFYY
jgi:hypothetical protein